MRLAGQMAAAGTRSAAKPPDPARDVSAQVSTTTALDGPAVLCGVFHEAARPLLLWVNHGLNSVQVNSMILLFLYFVSKWTIKEVGNGCVFKQCTHKHLFGSP